MQDLEEYLFMVKKPNNMTPEEIKRMIEEAIMTHRHDGNSAQQIDEKDIFTSSQIETIAGGGTTTELDLTKKIHSIDADAGGDIFTLPDGFLGQVTTITCLSATGVATITPANLSGGTSVTLNAAGETVVLQFVDTEWYIIGGNAYTVI